MARNHHRHGRGRPNSTAHYSDKQILEAVGEFGRMGASRQLCVSHQALGRRLDLIEAGRSPTPPPNASAPPELVLKGTSVLSRADGSTISRWDKTRMRGRLDEETQHVPDPKTISKVSTLFDQEGRVSQQWVSERPDDIRRAELWREAALAFAEDLPRVPIIHNLQDPACYLPDLLTVYPIGDHHMGMLSWKHETGVSYDLDIGERLLSKAMGYLVDCSPQSETAMVVVLGDFMHYDSQTPETPEHNNPLDSDGRHQKMIRASIRTIRRAIDMALEKHNKVHVIVEIGNHDPFSMAWMMESLAAIYGDMPRLTVDTSPSQFHYYSFGKCLFGVHHGHGVKLEDLPGIMALDRREQWGQALHCYWLTGHIHRRVAFDHAGCSIESYRILPPPDAWAFNKGYRPIRDMHAVVYHAQYGYQGRNVVSPWMLEEK